MQLSLMHNPKNDSGKSVRDIIDCTISNKVRLRCSDTPLRCGVPGGVSCETIPHCLNEGQTRNSNIRLHDQIVETLFSCYDDSPLHSEILRTFQMFQTYVSLSRYTHI